MRLLSRTTLIAGLAVAAAIGGTANAGSSVDRATGGGQILVASDGRGPGDTITFQARDDARGPVGSVNVIRRSTTAGAPGQGFHFKGTLTCIAVSGNTAKLAGKGINEDGKEQGFTLLVTDNGEGAADKNDVISLTYRSTNPGCGNDDSDDDHNTDLARGNAQVYDATS
jgi:hypothetical protein